MFNRIYVGYNKSVYRLRHKSLCVCVCTGKCHSFIFQGQAKVASNYTPPPCEKAVNNIKDVHKITSLSQQNSTCWFCSL